MKELQAITAKYDHLFVRSGLSTAAAVNRFAGTFYRDVGEIYDVITRVKNTERNPSGYSLNDAPILGLLVRSWKLFKEIVRYYEEDNAETVGVLERPLLEAVILARFLMISDESVIEDYRKCSYKDRLQLVQELREGSAFTKTKAGKRLVHSVLHKLAQEGLTEADFAEQKRRKWKLQGKTFRDIFRIVEHDALYPATYGMLSESIHGSWNDSLDFDLSRHDDGTFSAYPFFQSADIRFVTPLLRFTNPAYRLWLERIEAAGEGPTQALDWIEKVNSAIYTRFDELYDHNVPE